jgi:hypothetical protein
VGISHIPTKSENYGNKSKIIDIIYFSRLKCIPIRQADSNYSSVGYIKESKVLSYVQIFKLSVSVLFVD